MKGTPELYDEVEVSFTVSDGISVRCNGVVVELDIWEGSDMSVIGSEVINVEAKGSYERYSSIDTTLRSNRIVLLGEWMDFQRSGDRVTEKVLLLGSKACKAVHLLMSRIPPEISSGVPTTVM